MFVDKTTKISLIHRLKAHRPLSRESEETTDKRGSFKCPAPGGTITSLGDLFTPHDTFSPLQMRYLLLEVEGEKARTSIFGSLSLSLEKQLSSFLAREPLLIQWPLTQLALLLSKVALSSRLLILIDKNSNNSSNQERGSSYSSYRFTWLSFCYILDQT